MITPIDGALIDYMDACGLFYDGLAAGDAHAAGRGRAAMAEAEQALRAAMIDLGEAAAEGGPPDIPMCYFLILPNGAVLTTDGETGSVDWWRADGSDFWGKRRRYACAYMERSPHCSG
jgi:hypothetical protein